MNRFTTLGSCLLALLCIATVAPASSSALLGQPEFGRCVSVPPGTGEYELASCTGGQKAAGGNFDWILGAVKKNFASVGGLTVLETVGGVKIECKKAIVAGEYGTDEEYLRIHLIGCRDPAASVECRNAALEEITMEPNLTAETGFIHNHLNKEGKLVVAAGMALVLESVAEELGHKIKFECGTPHQFTLSGVALAQLSPIDKMSATMTAKLKQKAGKQTPSKFEGGLKEVPILQQTFPLTPPEEAGLSVTWKQTSEEPVELKATE